jgi:hypothetical protein
MLVASGQLIIEKHQGFSARSHKFFRTLLAATGDPAGSGGVQSQNRVEIGIQPD